MSYTAKDRTLSGGSGDAATVHTWSDQKQLSSLYNDGNDEIATLNRFSFPAVSFSPSFPATGTSITSSTTGIAVLKSMLSPRSPASSAASGGGGGVLSPRSPFRAISGSATFGSYTASASQTNSAVSSTSSSPSGKPSPSSSSVSASLLAHPSTPCSPLPPLSPRGQKLADSENYHKARCLNRIVEKRRKASDGTQDIVIVDLSPIAGGHMRRVSFKLSPHDPRQALGVSMPASLPSSSGATLGTSNSSSAGVALSLPTGNFDVGLGKGDGEYALMQEDGSQFEIRFSLPEEEMECLDSTPSSPL